MSIQPLNGEARSPSLGTMPKFGCLTWFRNTCDAVGAVLVNEIPSSTLVHRVASAVMRD